MTKQWKTVRRSGAIQKWEPNLVVTGVFHQLRDGQFGPLVDMTNGNGKSFTYGVPAVLASFLKEVAPGTELRITCKGKISLKSGNEAWDFSVEESAGDEADSSPTTGPDSDIPF
jgi:hypothetical protein